MLRVSNLTGFGGGAKPPIPAPVDDGDATNSSGLASHTYAAQTSTGPVTVLGITWGDGSSRTLNSATWNGDAVSILVQQVVAMGAGFGNAAICIIGGGARSGNLVLNFSGTVLDSEITKLSVSNLISIMAIDTDDETSAGGGADLDSLLSPGIGGIRIGVFANDADTTGVTWTNATEVSDIEVTNHRHSVAYDLGDNATTITADGGAVGEVIVGVSLR